MPSAATAVTQVSRDQDLFVTTHHADLRQYHACYADSQVETPGDVGPAAHAMHRRFDTSLLFPTMFHLEQCKL